jgi:hypothetical protein
MKTLVFGKRLLLTIDRPATMLACTSHWLDRHGQLMPVGGRRQGREQVWGAR